MKSTNLSIKLIKSMVQCYVVESFQKYNYDITQTWRWSFSRLVAISIMWHRLVHGHRLDVDKYCASNFTCCPSSKQKLFSVAAAFSCNYLLTTPKTCKFHAMDYDLTSLSPFANFESSCLIWMETTIFITDITLQNIGGGGGRSLCC